MLTNSEKETLILINQADSREGFFLVSTSNRYHLNRIVKRVGGENLTVRECRQEGVAVQWELRIPIRFLTRTSFGIKKSGGRKDFEYKKEQSPGGLDRG